MPRTLDQIRHEGLEALRQRLGAADMVRFLQQFETGSGDYAAQRRDWVDQTSLQQITQALERPTTRPIPPINRSTD